jgi:hypothetical protein
MGDHIESANFVDCCRANDDAPPSHDQVHVRENTSVLRLYVPK